MTISVLVVDDDRTLRETLAEFFATLGIAVRTAASASEGRQAAAEHAPDVVLVDLRLPDASGLVLLEALRTDDPELGVIMLTAHADVATAVRAMRQGALDFLEKPVDLETLNASVRRAAELVRLRREVSVLRALRGDEAVASAEGAGPTLERLIELAARNDEVPVLIVGETGTGKGFVARRIHDRSARASQPFVEVNGASLSALEFFRRKAASSFQLFKRLLQIDPNSDEGMFCIAALDRGGVYSESDKQEKAAKAAAAADSAATASEDAE